MRGLPPTPSDVVKVEQFWQTGDTEVRTLHYLFAPITAPLTAQELNDIAAQWFFFVTPDFLRALASDVTLGLLRLSTEGAAPANFVDEPAANSGDVPGDTASINAAACMTWYAGEQRDGHAHARLPLPRTHISADRGLLSELGWAETARGAADAIVHAHSILSPTTTPCLLGTVHRQHQGVPLVTAQFSPFLTGTASRFIATIGRRVKSRRQGPPIT